MSGSDSHDPASHPLDAIRDAVEALLRSDPTSTLGEINAVAARGALAYNRTPQEELGGLSPAQMHGLLTDDWSGTGVVRLDGALGPDDVAPSQTLKNVRLLLEAVGECGTVRATARGNLPRALVHALADRMLVPANYPAGHLSDRLNEEDVVPLHRARVLAELAGLMKRRKGEYSLTARGSRLAREERSGDLYTLLFSTYFRTMNLAYFDRFGHNAPAFQHMIAYLLYGFGRLGESWRSPAEIAAAILPAPVLSELPPSGGLDWAPSVTERRLLAPLEAFALAESRALGDERDFVRRRAYRPTPLFHRFLRFELD